MTALCPAAAGLLADFREGRIRIEIVADERVEPFDTLTVEVFAQGILMVSAGVRTPRPGKTAPVSIPVDQFPRLALPCTLTARIVEIDAKLDGEIALTALDDLWSRMMPFRASLRGTAEGRLLVGLDAAPVANEDLVFAVCEGTRTLGQMVLQGSDDRGFPLLAYDLPRSLLDGVPHQLTILHLRSQLPVTAAPVTVQLSIGATAQPDLATVASRLRALEKRVRERDADAYNSLAVELYRHIDGIIINQRDNFEREMAAMRALLGLAPQSAETPPTLPEWFICDFAGPLQGYGFHPVEHTRTGKPFRKVASHCGIVLPGLAPGATTLRVQGIRRPHDRALDGGVLALNGVPLAVRSYINPNSESWNLTAVVPADLPRADLNLVEMRFPQAVEGEPAPMDRTVGVLFLEVGAADQPAVLAAASP
ncbi:MAG: hypothetical protein MUF73_04605 [Rhodobacteraceae bacterium]|nr:hypothetical protein [Paracoccaceae bacterium]